MTSWVLANSGCVGRSNVIQQKRGFRLHHTSLNRSLYSSGADPALSQTDRYQTQITSDRVRAVSGPRSGWDSSTATRDPALGSGLSAVPVPVGDSSATARVTALGCGRDRQTAEPPD